ncbi:MAG: STAS domain-containing protein [Lachnospiraceae bacterium]|nr:STAS domain-containing protein [Lachnospiraceae bacterium]
MKTESGYQCVGEYVRIYLPSEVDENSCPQISHIARECMKKQGVEQLVFDFSNTVFMDSAGIGMLLARYKEVSFEKGKIFLTGENERVSRILKMSGIYTIMPHIHI